MFQKDRYLFLIMLGLWIMAEVLVNPIGNFPLNDDWAYSQNVYFLSEEGRFDFSDWPGMTLIVQVLWGALVSKIFGFSFTILRLSTLLLAVITSWSCFLLFRKYTEHRMLAFGTALLFMFNPFFFLLANSFMTEIPFLSVFLPAVYCFLKVMDGEENSRRRNYWLGGILFSLLATLIRQPGLFAPLAFGLAFLLKHNKRLGAKNILIALLPFVLSFAAMKWYTVWLDASQGLPPLYGQVGLLFDCFREGRFTFNLATRNNEMLFLGGLFALPLLLFLLPHYWRQSSGKQKIIAFLITGLICSTYFFHLKYLPFGNVFRNFAMGPNTMFLIEPDANSTFGNLAPCPSLPPLYWLGVKIIGITSSLLLVFQLSVSLMFRLVEKRWSTCFIFLLCLGYHAFLILNPHYFDRYTLITVPLLLLLLLPQSFSTTTFKRQRYPAYFSFALIALFSILTTHDYFSWNRARWEAVQEALVNRGVPSNKLYPGFEPDHWHRRPELQPLAKATEKDTIEYAVTFQYKLCGWEAKQAFAFDHWLPPGRDSVFLHRKLERDTAQYFVCDLELVDSTGLFLKTTNPNIEIENKALRDSTISYSGKYSLRLNKDHPYGFVTEVEVLGPCQRLVATAWRKKLKDKPSDAYLKTSIIAFSADDLYYQNDKVELVNKQGWELISCVLYPHNLTKADTLKVYLWNANGEDQWFDEFTVKSFIESED